MIEPLRAMTLTNPWCGLMGAGIKKIENRGQPIIKRDHIGKEIALHASRVLDSSVYSRIYEIAPELLGRKSTDEDPSAASIALGPDTESAWWKLSRITSSVIAVVTLADIIDAGPDFDGNPAVLDAHFHAALERGTVAADQRRWYFQRVGYVFTNVRLLREPFGCRGWQGLWSLTPEASEMIRARLVEVA